jgi:cell division protein ZapA
VKARERMAVLAALNLAYQRAETAAAEAHQQAATAADRRPEPPGSPPADGGSLDIEYLIRRIDAALGDDGHLL